MSTLPDSARFSIAPGSVVIVRDEEWLVTGVEQTTDGRLLRCQGLSELVRDTTASFYEASRRHRTCSTRPQATVVADDSPHYRRTRLWLEATLRKTAVPLDGTGLTVSAADARRPARLPADRRAQGARPGRTSARASCSPTRSASARRSRSA